MKEYKVMVKLDDGKWYRATGYAMRQDKPFTSLKDAEDYMKEYKEHYKNDAHHYDAVFKIMSREVTEWEDERR